MMRKTRIILTGAAIFFLAALLNGSSLLARVYRWDFRSGTGDGLDFSAAEGSKLEEVTLQGRPGVMFTPRQGETLELSFSLPEVDSVPEAGLMTIELDYFDRADSVKVRARRIEGRGDRWEVVAPRDEENWLSHSIYVTGRPWEVGETYRAPRWKQNVILLENAAPGADAADTAFRIMITPEDSRAVLAAATLRYHGKEFLAIWRNFEAELEALFFTQAELVIARARAEEEARQVMRALLYSEDNGLAAPVAEKAALTRLKAALLEEFRSIETELDSHFYDGRVALARGRPEEQVQLRQEIQARQVQLDLRISDLRKHADILRAGLPVSRGLEAGEKLHYHPHKWSANIPSYFRQRIRFFAFANSPWSDELWKHLYGRGRGRCDESWYRFMPLYGIEAMFRITGYSSTSPPAAGKNAGTGEGFDCVIDERLAEVEIPPHPDEPWTASLAQSAQQFRMYSNYGLKIIPAVLHLHDFSISGGLPRWFKDKYRGDNYLELSYEGLYNDRTRGSGTVNIWHPGIRDYVRDYAAVAGRQAAGNPDIVGLSFFNEPRFTVAGKSPGYNPHAITAFRQKLVEKHGAIEQLNDQWDSNYGSFADIKPPLPREEDAWQITPLFYEWHRFVAQSYQQYGRMITAAAKSVAPEIPVWNEGGMNRTGDIGHYHIRPLGWNNVSNYSLRRVHGLTIADAETGGGSAWEGEWEVTSEVARAALERNLFDAMLWGQRGFTFWMRYFTANASGYYAAFHDNPSGARVLATRDSSSLAILRDKADRFGDLLASTEVVNSGVGLVQAGDAMAGTRFGANGFRLLTQGLYSNYYPPFILHADDIVSGLEDLSDYRVLIMLCAPVVPSGLNEKMSAWVKQGGLLIAEGPWGIFNPYGHREGLLLKEAFGEVQAAFPPDQQHREAIAGGRMHRPLAEKYREMYRWASIGEWHVPVELVAPLAGVEVVMADTSGAPIVLEATLGRGRVIMTTTTAYGLRPYFVHRIKEVVPSLARAGRPLSLQEKVQGEATNDSLYLVLREDGAGNRFLGAINPDSGERSTVIITLAGRYRTVTDLGVTGSFPVPLTIEGDFTRFRTTLAAGEGTIYALERD